MGAGADPTRPQASETPRKLSFLTLQFTLSQSIEILERTPATLRALLKDVSAQWARGTEGPDTFSPFDNIGHLIDGEETENVRTIQAWNLTEAQLGLSGEHPRLGPVTLRQLLAAWVVHDLGHIAQVARVMAKQYRAEVGPWVPFLPVLTDHEVPRS